MIDIITAGESHGEELIGIITGIPANLYIDEEYINDRLRERQMGIGRSERMKIESDKILIVSGVMNGYSTGAPIGIKIKNRGRNIELDDVTRPRPGHGDLVGALKYNQIGGRNILERASARETAMRVALGSICRLLLKEFNINIYSHIVNIGGLKSKIDYYNGINLEELEGSNKFLDKEFKDDVIRKIKETKAEGDTLGGTIELIGTNLPVGLGSHTIWNRKLDSNLAGGIISIQGIKAIEFGIGFQCSELKGSEVQDEIYYDGNYRRYTNNLGGIEAGMSNGEDLVIRASMKPIPTLMKALRTVDMNTKEVVEAKVERSDTCALEAASIVVESVVSHILANEFLIKFAGDSMEEIEKNFNNYKIYLESR